MAPADHDQLGRGIDVYGAGGQNTTSLYIVRFLLGAAEAGFFPGVVLYLTWWIPSRYRARIIASFMVAIPLANFIGSPLSGLILTLDGWFGLRGWHLLFIIEGLPAVLLGIAAFFILRDRPHQAGWLNERQKAWLENTLQAERQQQKQIGHISTWQLLKHRQIWLMALIYAGASSAGTTLSVWSPQLLKSFHLDNLTTGLLNAIPYGLASVLMIVWGRSSDRTNERRWHTALTLFMIAAGVFAAFIESLAADYHCYSQYHINWRLFGEGAILGASLRLDEQHLSRRGAGGNRRDS